jgi:type IV secretory pathway VirB2 component (pilin)
MSTREIFSTPNLRKDAKRRGAAPCVVCLGRILPTLSLASLWSVRVLAQASPFETGATALQDNILTLLTPVAVILVIALGVAAMVNRVSWAWSVAAIAGIALSFGAPQIVDWVRGLFGV